MFAGQQGLQRHVAGGFAGLDEAHRPHHQAREPARTGVAPDIVVRDGGSGEDELTEGAASVDLGTDVIPHPGAVELPLVDQPRGVSGQDQAGIDLKCLERGFIAIQIYGAGRGLLSRAGLAARLRSLDHDGSGRGQPVGEKGVDDPRPVLHYASLGHALL